MSYAEFPLSFLFICFSVFLTIYEVCESVLNPVFFSRPVQVQNCQVSSKPGGENDDKWTPWTPRLVGSLSSPAFASDG